ncbi:MAG: hypothetical protein AMJ78_05975 [Omnitrophica WOR_2 bacterium SM23_29]|nr:MAG: hypothetical protein AMJ78_05975 [Omnitrophica WOR_2 bacterium SM23_29]
MEEKIVLEKVRDLTAQTLSDSNVEIVELTYRREGGRMVLRFTVDKAGGINIGECGRLSQKIERILDDANVVQESYVLEVQSPGLDRPLVKTSDFERAIGEEIVVSTYAPISNKREHTGRLKWVNDEKIIIETPVGEKVEIPRDKIAKASLKISF